MAERIDNISVTAECPIEKFTGYIFNDFYNDGKVQIFKNLGYIIADSAALKTEMEKQAYQAYLYHAYHFCHSEPQAKNLYRKNKVEISRIRSK